MFRYVAVGLLNRGLVDKYASRCVASKSGRLCPVSEDVNESCRNSHMSHVISKRVVDITEDEYATIQVNESLEEKE